MFEFFLVLFGESAFSALDFSNCQMRQKKKEKKDQLYYLFLFLGLGGEGDERGSMSAVAVNMKNLCDNLERVDMYIFFINHCVYLIY